jgi:hypothetical protein
MRCLLFYRRYRRSAAETMDNSRDLKPSSVLLVADGPRVIDFGIARALEASTVTRTGVRVASPQFMATAARKPCCTGSGMSRAGPRLARAG